MAVLHAEDLDLVDAFRRAWAEVQGDSFSHELARMSLRATAVGVPELHALLVELEAAGHAVEADAPSMSV